MKLLDDYFALQRQIYEHFGYVEDWVVIPLEDSTEYFWRVTEEGEVQYSEDETFEDEDKLYSNEIYTQRHLPKHIYRADDCTMICVDTHCDGNHFLQIFDNTKERPSP